MAELRGSIIAVIKFYIKDNKTISKDLFYYNDEIILK